MKKVLLVASICFLAIGGVVSAGTIELPRTGQTACYNAVGDEISCFGTGQDGEIQSGAYLAVPRFTTNYYDLTVVDNLTGLMWTFDSRTPDPYNPPVCAPDSRFTTWPQALEYIDCLNAYVDPDCGGQPGYLCHNDWRLPNRLELRSLMVYNFVTGPALSSDYPFINVEDGWHYWSSTSCTTYLDPSDDPDDDGAGAWVANMWDGSEYCQRMDKGCREDAAPEGCSTPIFVWPVRQGQIDGNPDPTYPANIPKTGQTGSVALGDDGDIQAGVRWPDPRFTVTYCDANGPCTNPAEDCDQDPSNDIVTDNLTGIIWIRIPDNSYKVWDESLAYANELVHCGYSNWRLPNINELQSMIHNGEPDTAVWLNTSPPYYFIGVESFYHWSSTTDPTERNKAMVVDLWDGSIENRPKTEYYNAWPVRLPGGLLNVLKTGQGFGTVTSTPPGIECGPDCSELFREDEVVTLTAVAEIGSTFKGWSGACTGIGTCTIPMKTDAVVTALFSPSCTYSISPLSYTFYVNGGTIRIAVTAKGYDCIGPSISTPVDWIHAALTSWKSNKGIVTVTADPSYSSVKRVGTIGIGNKTFTAIQMRRSCTPGGVPPTFTPSSSIWPQAGGTGSFTITFSPKAAVDCQWSAQPGLYTPWVSTDSSGVGNGIVDYSVDPNLSTKVRSGRIRVRILQNPTGIYGVSVKQLN